RGDVRCGGAACRAVSLPLYERPALVQDADAVRSPAGVEGAARAAARRAAPPPARSGAAPAARGRVGRERRRAPARDRGEAAGRLRLAARLRFGGGATSDGGRRR